MCIFKTSNSRESTLSRQRQCRQLNSNLGADGLAIVKSLTRQPPLFGHCVGRSLLHAPAQLGRRPNRWHIVNAQQRHKNARLTYRVTFRVWSAFSAFCRCSSWFSHLCEAARRTWARTFNVQQGRHVRNPHWSHTLPLVFASLPVSVSLFVQSATIGLWLRFTQGLYTEHCHCPLMSSMLGAVVKVIPFRLLRGPSQDCGTIDETRRSPTRTDVNDFTALCVFVCVVVCDYTLVFPSRNVSSDTLTSRFGLTLVPMQVSTTNAEPETIRAVRNGGTFSDVLFLSARCSAVGCWLLNGDGK